MIINRILSVLARRYDWAVDLLIEREGFYEDNNYAG